MLECLEGGAEFVGARWIHCIAREWTTMDDRPHGIVLFYAHAHRHPTSNNTVICISPSGWKVQATASVQVRNAGIDFEQQSTTPLEWGALEYLQGSFVLTPVLTKLACKVSLLDHALSLTGSSALTCEEKLCSLTLG